ncbi:MAG: glycosyltransferase family 4 protein [Chloroflexota bacterium]
MHFLIDARLALPGQMTGIGRYLVGLAQGFAGLNGPDSFEFWVQAGLPAGHALRRLDSPRLRLHALPLAHMSLRAQWAIPSALRRARYDLFHYPHFDLPLLAPGPLVATLHDLKYLARPDFFPQFGRARRLAMALLMRSAARRARRLIVVSEFTRQDVLRRLGADPQRVQVIYEGVDERCFQPLPDSALQAVRRSYRLDQPYILFLGERRPHKNIPGLLRAFAALPAETRTAHLLVLAGNPYAGDQGLRQLAAQLDIAGCVRWIDNPPDADLPALYQAAAALALLSYYEGFGLPVLEAMASGVPVVISDRTALPEVAGEAALAVPPDDPAAAAAALQAVLPGGAQRLRCIAAGRARAAGFTWQRCAEQTLEVYHAALA